MLLSIIIPVYNERELAVHLLRKIAAVEFGEQVRTEVIIVDDGSTDGTPERISSFLAEAHLPNFQLREEPINRGKGSAVRTGMKMATGDLIIIQDADLEYDPEDIKDVIAPILAGSAKIVYGSRILREKALGRSGIFGLITGKHPHSYMMAYLGGVVITQWTNILTGASLTDEPTCYKCFSRPVLQGIEIECDDFSWEPEITMKLLRRGFPIAEVPISYHPRKNADGKKINWKHGISALWTLVKFRFK